MSVFMVNAALVRGQASEIKKQKRKLDNYSIQVLSISRSLQLGSSERIIKNELKKISEQLNEEGIDCEKLGAALIDIVDTYIKTENEILDGKSEGDGKTGNTSTSGNTSDANTDNSSERAKSDSNILEQIKDKFNLNDAALDIVKLILGFIPGVNCLVDIYDLVNDIKDASKDGKLSAGESFTIAMDTISLASDVISFGALVKAMEGVADGVKVAKTGGFVEKAVNVSKGADSFTGRVVNGAQNSRAGRYISNSRDVVSNGIKNSRAGQKVSDTARTVKNSNFGRTISRTADHVEQKITKTVANKVFKYSDKSKIAYTDAVNAGNIYAKEVINNIKDYPKSKVKDKAEEKVADILDGK